MCITNCPDNTWWDNTTITSAYISILPHYPLLICGLSICSWWVWKSISKVIRTSYNGNRQNISMKHISTKRLCSCDTRPLPAAYILLWSWHWSALSTLAPLRRRFIRITWTRSLSHLGLPIATWILTAQHHPCLSMSPQLCGDTHQLIVVSQNPELNIQLMDLSY